LTEGTIASESAAIDALERLKRWGGETLVRDMSEMFAREMPQRLADARAALSVGEVATAGNATHSMKSSAGQFGAVALEKLCADAEQLAEEANTGSLMSVLDEIARELDAFLQWLAASTRAKA